MKVAKISISNVAGIEFFEFKPGAITRIEGGNKAGKTSLMRALRSLVEGGRDVKLIREGTKRAEVAVEWEDGSTAVKTITPATTDVKFLDSEGIEQAKPQTRIRQRLDAVSFNPKAFLEGSKADRLDALIRALKIEPPVEQLREAGTLYEDFDLPETTDPFRVLKAVRKHVYDARSAVGGQRREAEGTVSGLSKDLPKETPQGCAEELEALGQRMSEIEDLFERAEALAEQNRDLTIEKARRVYSEAIAKARKIRDDEAKILQQRRGELTAKHEAATKAQGRIEDLEKAQGRVRRLNQVWSEHDAHLKAVDRIREGLLSDLPVEGIAIEDGEVVLGGVEFPQWSETEQYQLAVKICKMLAGPDGLIGIDGIQFLEAKNLAGFEKAAEKSGLTFILTRVGEGPLRVTDEFHLKPEPSAADRRKAEREDAIAMKEAAEDILSQPE